MITHVSDPQLALELRGAPARGEIVPAFQPQFDLVNHAIHTVELLARWDHPQRGAIPPSTFIPIAEEHGSINELGMFMLERACGYSVHWHLAGHDVGVSVNVSALQLENPMFSVDVRHRVQEIGLDPSTVTLELTESRPLHDMDAAARQLQELRDLGFGASIDDYGQGYSDLSRLLELPVSELKLDRTVILEAEHHGPQVVARVVAMAKQKGLRVVAEGIETPAQLELAESLDCDLAQGYLLSKPVSEADITALLEVEAFPLPGGCD